MTRKRRGAYLGGSTIIGPRTVWTSPDDQDESWVADHVAREDCITHPTPFEAAVHTYVNQCVEAALQDLQWPPPPVLVVARYQDKRLRDWLKGIRHSRLYKAALARSRQGI
jgi:hypothetical protein